MDRIEQHIHDTVKQVEQEAALNDYGRSLLSPEEQERFDKEMAEYKDFYVPEGAECRADCFD